MFGRGFKLKLRVKVFFYRGFGKQDKMRTGVKSRRVKRERWVLRSLKLKKEDDPLSSLLPCEDVEEVEMVVLAEHATEGKEVAKMAALHHSNGNLCDAYKLRSVKEHWIVKSLKLEKENNCRDPCAGHLEEVDTDVEEVEMIYLRELVEEESDGGDVCDTSPLHQNYLQSPGENLWESDLEIYV